MKKITALLLALLMLMSTALSVSATEPPRKFDDVPEDAWYAAHVDTVSWGLMKGTSENTFSPDMTLSRAMCVTVLYRMVGEPDVSDIINDSDGIRFTDVQENEWYTAAIVWAADKKIVNGRGGTVFDPHADITRAELATILYRYVDKMNLNILQELEDTDFVDGESIPVYAEYAVKVMTRAGIIKGKDGNRFDPDSTATRAEAAALFSRLSQNTTKQNMALLEKIGASMKVVTDITGGYASPTVGDFGLNVYFRPETTTGDELKKADIKVDAVLRTDCEYMKLNLKRFESIDFDYIGFYYSEGPHYLKRGDIVYVSVTVTYEGESETYTFFNTVVEIS